MVRSALSGQSLPIFQRDCQGEYHRVQGALWGHSWLIFRRDNRVDCSGRTVRAAKHCPDCCYSWTINSDFLTGKSAKNALTMLPSSIHPDYLVGKLVKNALTVCPGGCNNWYKVLTRVHCQGNFAYTTSETVRVNIVRESGQGIFGWFSGETVRLNNKLFRESGQRILGWFSGERVRVDCSGITTVRAMFDNFSAALTVRSSWTINPVISTENQPKMPWPLSLNNHFYSAWLSRPKISQKCPDHHLWTYVWVHHQYLTVRNQTTPPWQQSVREDPGKYSMAIKLVQEHAVVPAAIPRWIHRFSSDHRS